MILGRLYAHQYNGHAQSSIEVNSEFWNGDQIFQGRLGKMSSYRLEMETENDL